MTSPTVQAPLSLLLNPDLTPSAKVVWLASRLQAEPGRAMVNTLARSTGLTRTTVRKGLDQIAVNGWQTPPAEALAAAVPIPAALLTAGRIGAQARLLFGLLQLLPSFRSPAGQFAYQELADLARISRNTAAKALDELAGSNWITIQRANRLARVHFALSSPAEQSIQAACLRLENAKFYGEALMREYLSLLVDSQSYTDNASPQFLINPLTEEPFSLDRFYPSGVAFEFNGPQHYRPTNRYTAADAAKQKWRDYMKLGICITHDVTLVTIHPVDLSSETMRRKIGNLLPLRDLAGFEPLVDFLESRSRDYQRWIARL